MKKLLALVLALVMVMGLSVVSTNAAFTDEEKIDHNEAVEVLTSLKVINGMGDGSFNPTGDVTRAQMAKMIAIILLGADVQDSAFTGTKTDLTDINGHWGEGFIKFCVSQKIVAGYGDGTFLPDKNVTTAEASKMLLTALGYNAEVQEYTGANWSINVIRDAQYKKLFEDLSGMKADVAINRDQAAQMIWNTVQRGMIVKSAGQERTNDGKITDQYRDSDLSAPRVTLLGQTFNGTAEVGYLTATTFDSNKKEWTYRFNSTTRTFGGNNYTDNDAITNGDTAKSTDNYTDLYGMKVKAVINNTNNTLYGMFAKDSKVLATALPGTISDIDATKNTVKVSGETIKLEAATLADGRAWYQSGVGAYTQVASDGTTAAPLNAAGNVTTLGNWTRAFTAKFIDNKDDGKVDTIIVIPHTVAQVTWVGTDTVIVNNGIGTLDLDDCYFAYGTPAKEDYVLYTNPAVSPVGAYTFQKLDLQTGTVDATRTDTVNATNSYQLDGTWYAAGAASVNGSKTASYNAGGGLLIPGADVNDTIEYVSFGEKIFYNKVTDIAATTKQIAMVISANSSGASTNLGVNVAKAKLLLADGTKPTVQIAKIAGTGVTAVEYKASLDNATTVTTEVVKCIGKLVTYKVNGDGNYELTTVSAANKAGYKTYNGTSEAYNNKKIGKADLAKDTVVYVLGGTEGTPAATNDGKIYSGAELMNTFGATVWGDNGYALTDTVNGFTYARVAVLSENSGLPTITGASNYAYLTAATTRTIENGDTYLNYTMWTENGAVTAKEKNTEATGLYPKGAIITYDTTSTDGVIKNVNVVNAVGGIVTGWKDGAATGDIQISGLGTSKVDANDTTVLFIDSHAYKGYETGTIMRGEDKNSDGTPDWPNVRFIGNGTVLSLLVVDVNQDMSGTLAGGASTAEIEAELAVFNDVTVAGTVTLTKNLQIPAGKTLRVAGTFDDSASDYTVTGLGSEAGENASKLVIQALGTNTSINELQVPIIEFSNGLSYTSGGTHTTATETTTVIVDGAFEADTTNNLTFATANSKLIVDAVADSDSLIGVKGTTVDMTVNGNVTLDKATAMTTGLDLDIKGKLNAAADSYYLTGGANLTLTGFLSDEAVKCPNFTKVTLDGDYESTGALTIGDGSSTTEFVVAQYRNLSTSNAGGITISANATLTAVGTINASNAAGAITNTAGVLKVSDGTVTAASLGDYTNNTHVINNGTINLKADFTKTSGTFALAAGAAAAEADRGVWNFKGAVSLTSSAKMTVDVFTTVNFEGNVTWASAGDILPTATNSSAKLSFAQGKTISSPGTDGNFNSTSIPTTANLASASRSYTADGSQKWTLDT